MYSDCQLTEKIKKKSTMFVVMVTGNLKVQSWGCPQWHYVYSDCDYTGA
jgi:hypothetical protein